MIWQEHVPLDCQADPGPPSPGAAYFFTRTYVRRVPVPLSLVAISLRGNRANIEGPCFGLERAEAIDG